MFTEIFEKLKINKELVCLYCNRHKMENFMCGFILDYDSKFVLLNCVTPEGANDGIVLQKCDEVVLVEYCNLYTADLKKIVQPVDCKLSEDLSKNLLEGILNHTKESNLVVSIKLKDSSVIATQGFVHSFTDSIVTLNAIDYNGSADGFSVCKLEDISSIAFDNWRNYSSRQINSQK